MTLCYIGIKRCGCVVSILIRPCPDLKWFQEEIDNWILNEYEIKIVDVEEARKRLQYCKHK